MLWMETEYYLALKKEMGQNLLSWREVCDILVTSSVNFPRHVEGRERKAKEIEKGFAKWFWN